MLVKLSYQASGTIQASNEAAAAQPVWYHTPCCAAGYCHALLAGTRMQPRFQRNIMRF
jgi:hypothetical protein